MDVLELVVVGGEDGGTVEFDGVTLVSANGVEVVIEDGRAVVKVAAGQKLTLRAERPEPR